MRPRPHRPHAARRPCEATTSPMSDEAEPPAAEPPAALAAPAQEEAAAPTQEEAVAEAPEAAKASDAAATEPAPAEAPKADADAAEPAPAPEAAKADDASAQRRKAKGQDAVMVEEVRNLKRHLGADSTAEEQLNALKKLRVYGVLSDKVLSETRIGIDVNTLSKGSADQEVKSIARELVDIWRQAHRKRKASLGGDEGPLKRTASAASDSSLHLDRTPTNSMEAPTPLASQDSARSGELQRGASAISLGGEGQEGGDAAVPKKMTPQREKVLKKLIEALGVEEKLDDVEEGSQKESPDDNARESMRDPVVLAKEIEEELSIQCSSEKEYLGQARSIIFNLKDSKNKTFSFKLMVGFYKPSQVPKLSAEDMASDAKVAERAKLRQDSMEAIQTDWALRHGQQKICGLFTCGKCKGVKTTYFQMQTRSSDEPMTTFVTCLTCNNRWKFC